MNEKQHFEYSDCTLTENLDDRLAEGVKCSGTFKKKNKSQQLKRGVISSDRHRVYERKKVGSDTRISNA